MSVTEHNSGARRGRPVTERGALLRALGITRRQTWQWVQLASIPKDLFEQLLRETPYPTAGAILRKAGKLAEDRPRPPERAREAALDLLDGVCINLADLVRELRETGTDKAIKLAGTAHFLARIARGELESVSKTRAGAA